MAVTITAWAVSIDTAFAKHFTCEDSDENPILIIGRPKLVSLGVTNVGNQGNTFGPLEGEEDLFGLQTSETGIEALLGWSVIQEVLEDNGVTFNADAQASIDTYLAGLAYAPDAAQAWTTSGIDDSLLADMAE